MAVDYSKRSAPEPDPAVGRVTLTKAAPSVSLTKRGSATGTLRVNLTWTARPAGEPAKGGFLKRLTAAAPTSIDLDLGCLYEFTDGSKGVVQALGNSFASRQEFSTSPVVRLDGDDRSGGSAGGENLLVDLAQTARIRRLLIFAYIYEGVPNWAAAQGVVTLHPQAGAPVEVRLDESDPGSPMCAIALLENVGGDLQVRREVRYVKGGQQALDEAYGWGMNWARGRK